MILLVILLLMLMQHQQVALLSAVFMLLLHRERAEVRRRSRRFWVLPRQTVEWYDLFMNVTDQHAQGIRYHTALRMSRDTFVWICEALREPMTRMDTRMRDAIPVERAVAVALFRLATGCRCYDASEKFGVGPGTVSEILHRFCVAAVSQLLQQEVCLPSGAVLQEVMNGFEERSGLQGIAGALDGTHIRLRMAPNSKRVNRANFWNRKGFYSMLLLTVVDHRGLIVDLFCKFPGCVHDSAAFNRSPLRRLMNRGRLFQGTRVMAGGEMIAPVILADSGFPLQSQVIKAYADGLHDDFDNAIKAARVVVENSYARCKGRWRIMTNMNVDIGSVPVVIATCITLWKGCRDIRLIGRCCGIVKNMMLYLCLHRDWLMIMHREHL